MSDTPDTPISGERLSGRCPLCAGPTILMGRAGRSCLTCDADRLDDASAPDVARQLTDEIDRLRAALAEAELAAEQLLADRDRCEEWADALAYAIAPIEQIGEHSSLNSPWQNAIAALANRDATIVELKGLLREHTDNEKCSFDHHGYCQTHSDFGIEPGDICYMERSRRAVGESENP